MFNSSNIKMNFNENSARSKNFFLSPFLASPFRYRANNINTNFRDFDLNNDFLQNIFQGSKNKNPFFSNNEMSQKRELSSNNNFNMDKYTNSRTKTKQISSDFNEVLNNNNINQSLGHFNFNINRSSNIFPYQSNNLKENKKIKYADDYNVQKRNFLNDSAKKSAIDESNPIEKEKEKDQKFSENNSQNNFSFKFPENKYRANSEKNNS
jgi:hypothetical protein